MNQSSACIEQTISAPPSTGWLAALGTLYCRLLHRDISRPVQGKYRCWRCLREYNAGW